MEKKKIAESIIIRVGGGIREVFREPSDIPEVIDTYNVEAESAKAGKIPVLRSENNRIPANQEDKVVN